MVKEFYLGLFAAIVCALAALTYAVPVSKISVSQHFNGSHVTEQPQEETLTDDGSIRSERSTNLSHITGSARKIRMYVKNRHLQVLPDGTVNGTSDDTSDYTVLQRTTVNIGQLKIQGVATCQYLCMDSCGLLYGSKEFLDECVFNEMIEQSHYNTYSSARYSNTKRTMYLALNKRGQSRKVQIRAQQQLGKLSTYTRVLTQPVSAERVEDLVNRLLHASGGNISHPLRHHGAAGHLCSVGVTPLQTQQVQKKNPKSTAAGVPTDAPGVDRLRCRRRKKRKKKRRRCQDDDDSESCLKKTPAEKGTKKNNKLNQQKCGHSKQDECQRIASSKLVTVKKNPNKKQRLGEKQLNSLRVVKKKNKKQRTNKNSKKINQKLKHSQEVGVGIRNTTESVVESPQVNPDMNEDYGGLAETSRDLSSSSASLASMEETSSWEQLSTLSSNTMTVESYSEDSFFLSTSPQTFKTN